MGNFIATRAFIYIAGNIINPDQNNQNETGIYTQHNAAFNGTTGHGHTGAIGDGPTLGPSAIDLTADYTFTGTINAPGMTPLGSIIPFYDFAGFATFNSSYWKYCDGTVIAAGSPLTGQTTPDLSNRYLVGFGTEGGADIGSAAWATVPVGNASHEINLQHLHDDSHGHADNLSFTVDAHVHDDSHGHADTLAFAGVSHFHNIASELQVANDNTGVGYVGRVSGSPSDVLAVFPNAGGGSSIYAYYYYTEGTTSTTTKTGSVTAFSGSTGAASVNTTSKSGGVTAFSGNTGNALSTTQSIQPRSVRVRYIMRIK